jgi:hypothetical protein
MRLSKNAVIEHGNRRRPTFLVCLPTFGTIDIAHHVASQQLMPPVNATLESMVEVTEEVGVARQKFLQYFLNTSRAEILFMLGDDMIPEWNAFIRLYKIFIKEDWDVLSALYFLKQDPPEPILRRTGIVGALEEGVHYKLGETVQSDLVGMDFVMIRRSFLEKLVREMPPPYFRTSFANLDTEIEEEIAEFGGISMHTEDAYFCNKAKQVKAKIGVATSVRVGHLDVKTGQIY